MSTNSVAMRDAFLERLWREMQRDPQIFFLCADFGSPIVDQIRADFPDRFVNVGIAEQNLINVSSGMALEGYKVFAYAIAPFITMRCYEQIRVNLALLSTVRPLNVNLIGVGAGYSYVMSGPTHQCYEDLTLMRTLPKLRLLSPADCISATALIQTCLNYNEPKYLRLDAQVLPIIYDITQPDIGKGFNIHSLGDSICIVATGYMLHTALEVLRGLPITGSKIGLIDLFDLKHFSEADFEREIDRYSVVVSLEEGFRGQGGLDSMLFDFIARRNLNIKLKNIGVELRYSFDLGTRKELHDAVGIGTKAVTKTIIDISNNIKNK